MNFTTGSLCSGPVGVYQQQTVPTLVYFHSFNLKNPSHLNIVSRKCANSPGKITVFGGPDGHPFWPVHLQVA